MAGGEAGHSAGFEQREDQGGQASSHCDDQDVKDYRLSVLTVQSPVCA